MDTDVPQVVLVKEAPEEQSARIDKQDPEQEDLWTSLEGEQLLLKPHLQQMADRDVPTSSSAGQMKAKAGGGAETSRNPHLNRHERTSDSSETEASGDEEDDVNLGSKPETGDDDWNENRPSGSDVETGQKPFACELCDQTFRRKKTLNNHVRFHTGQKPFTCELCDQTFWRKKTLNNHVRVHTGQKPFACELCDKKFTQKKYLNRHVRGHTGQKPFTCEICGQSFRQKPHLNTHMRVHTGYAPFECEHCGQRFTRQTHLNRHMKIYRRCKKLSA